MKRYVLSESWCQLVETRKRLEAQIKAYGKLGSADMFEAIDIEFKSLLDRQIAKLEVQIEQTIDTDDALATTASILRSVPVLAQWPARCSSPKCLNSAKSQARKPQRSQALRPLHMTEGSCAGNAPSVVGDGL